ncbi:MAG: hypothetical protein HYY13_11080 [Nitrospirae bacterium]|nr:hypothetical protein [Nitrospirota bacterium]
MKAWLERYGLEGRKAYMALGVGAVVLMVGIGWVVLRSEDEEAGFTPMRQAGTSRPMGEMVPQARPRGGAIDFGHVDESVVRQRINMELEELKQGQRELRLWRAEMENARKEEQEERGGTATKLEELRLSVQAVGKNVQDQLDAIRAGGGMAGAKKAEVEPLPPPKIVVPKKQEKPRAEAGRGTRGVVASPYYLPPGSLVRVRTLNGVSAYPSGTSGSTTFPVAMVVMDNWVSPNAYSIPMKGCTVLGRADGDLSSERVRITARLFSCVFPGGRTLDRELTAFVTGPDGGLGIAGKVTDRRGRRLGASFIAGFAAGLGQAFSVQEVTRVVAADGTERQIVTGDALTHASTSALSQAMADIAKFMREEAARLLPTVDIPGGIDGTLVTEEGIDIPEIANLFREEVQ